MLDKSSMQQKLYFFYLNFFCAVFFMNSTSYAKIKSKIGVGGTIMTIQTFKSTDF